MHRVPDGAHAECAVENGHCAESRYAARCSVPCSLQKGNEGDMCEQSREKDPYHPFSCKHGGARARPRLISKAGRYAEMERRVLELYDWVIPKAGDDPVMVCAIMDVVCWFLGVLQQIWVDVSV